MQIENNQEEIKIQPFKRIVFDIETNGLIEHMVDFSVMPYKLKPTAQLWCVSVRCLETDKEVMFIHDDHMDITEVDPDLLTDEEKEDLEYVKSLKLLPMSKLGKALEYADEVISHNGIKFDLPALKLFGIIDYQIGYPNINGNTFKTISSINDKETVITDTFVWSQLLWCDRPGGHSLLNLGKQGDVGKLDFDDFSRISLSMIKYCSYDTRVGKNAYLLLMREKEEMISNLNPNLNISFDCFDKPYSIEAKLADIMFKQEHWGFYYDLDKSHEFKKELQELLEERYNKVTPLLPPRPLNKGEQKVYTPPLVKTVGDIKYNDKTQDLLDRLGATYNTEDETFEYKGNIYPLNYLKGIEKLFPPTKRKTKGGDLTSAMNKFLTFIGAVYDPISDTYTYNGVEYPVDYEGCVKETLEAPEIVLSSHMKNFIEKVGAQYEEGSSFYIFEGREYDLDYDGCIKETASASIKDLDHLKGYLISLGWDPSEWKIRDLTIDSKKKKKTPEQIQTSIDKYVEQTFFLPYTKHRLEFLGLSEEATPEQLKELLETTYKANPNKALKVKAAPPLKVGAAKDLCPNLEKFAEEKSIYFIKDVVEYFTFQHRLNAIAGNYDEETGEYSSGFESNVRENQRIPTVIFSNNTNTSRMSHKVVCNIPKVSVLYGKLRELFTSGPDHFQFGFDYASLEARIESHYILQWPELGAVELAESLLAEKPNDLHSINAQKLGISRDQAKSISYGLN